jgi:alpha-L-fucosidase 2
MDGPDWGTFTTGGAWLTTHLWERYLYTGDEAFLAASYPVMKGAAEFFLNFLVEDPKSGRLVTCPSTSPENFPGWPGNDPFFDEVCAWMTPGTTICAGSTIDVELLNDLFTNVAAAAEILGLDAGFRQKVLETKKRLPPLQIGAAGDLQEWLEDWPQKEKSHRHISHLYGLFPGSQISVRRTPELARGARAVLDQRGLPGNGWSSAWKAACWARLGDAPKAMANFDYAVHNSTFDNLFSICARALQVDGSFGISAALMEMLLQSHEGEIFLLPCRPAEWPEGRVRGLRARGGFEVDVTWAGGEVVAAEIRSELGRPCRVRTTDPVGLFEGGSRIGSTGPDGSIVFETVPGGAYVLRRASAPGEK